jgi:hypothetical protein
MITSPSKGRELYTENKNGTRFSRQNACGPSFGTSPRDVRVSEDGKMPALPSGRQLAGQRRWRAGSPKLRDPRSRLRGLSPRPLPNQTCMHGRIDYSGLPSIFPRREFAAVFSR